MAEDFVDALVALGQRRDRRVTGAVAGHVVGTDRKASGRVRVRVAALGNVELFARVAVPVAGRNRGFWAMPHVGDEVLVIFENGETAVPYVIGGLWSDIDYPPTQAPSDTENKVIVRTSSGHVVELDDRAGTVLVRSASGHQVKLAREAITVSTKDAKSSIEMTSAGDVTIKATAQLILDATKVKVKGKIVELEAAGNATISARGRCAISGSTVGIN